MSWFSVVGIWWRTWSFVSPVGDVLLCCARLSVLEVILYCDT